MSSDSPSPEDYLNQFNEDERVLLVGPLNTDISEITEPVIFVDGGSNWRQYGIGISIGDGDSFTGALDYPLDPEKDFSDLSFALGLLGERFSEIQLRGFLGGRRDHELLNLGEVFHFLNQRQTRVKVTLNQSVIAFSAGRWQLEVNGTFSLVVFEPSVVTLSGHCKYHIAGESTIRPVSSYGLSNEGYGLISVSTSSPLFIFFNG